MIGPQIDPLTVLMPTPLAPPPRPSTRGASPMPLARAGRALEDQRLTAVLRGAARGLAFAEAELWLLDDASERLARRVAWSNPPHADAAEPLARPLADCPADLAALAGGAVIFNGDDVSEHLGADRSAGLAVGVPVASDLSIHGVLWLYGEDRDPDDAEIELVEIVAARIALELERNALLDEPSTRPEPFSEPEPTSLVAELPSHELAHDTLQAAGWVEPHAGVALHDWCELPDGRVVAMTGFVLDSPGVGSESSLLAAQTVRVAARTLADGAPDAGALLDRVNETLWQSTAAGEGVAFAIAVLDADGAGSFAAAGPTVALRVGPADVRSAATDETPLGWDLDATSEAVAFSLEAGESLVLAVGDPRLTSPGDERALADTFRAATGDARRTMTPRVALRRLQNAGLDSLAAATAVRRR